MDDILLLVNQIGPLPITTTFQAPADGQLSFFLSGSGWTQTAATWVQIALEMDGVPVAIAGVFANAATTHMAVVPVFAPVNMTAGQHTLTIVAANPTTETDLNDFFHVSLHL
jgi:hypothetical protein